MPVIMCTRPAQDKANQNPGMGGGGAYEIFSKEAIGNLWLLGEGSKFSSCMLLKGYPCYSK